NHRRSVIRISIELLPSSSPVHRKDLVVRLTDDTDLYFLYNLVISEEDFQSLKVQQGLLIDFTSFPQKFIDLLEQCISEQDRESPRFLLQFTSASSAFDHSPSNLNIVETNAFKHLTHLSLKLLPGSDADIKKYLATCLSTVKEEKQQLDQKLRKTEEDLTRQLNYAQQTLSEKSRELDKLRSEWTSQTTSLSSRHMHDLSAEREKALETQARLQQQNEQLRQELESSHHRSTQQLQTKVSELDTANRELMDKKYKSDSTIRDLKAKLASLEEECQRSKQQVLSLRRENSTLDIECHEKERLVNQLQTRVAVLEQEIKDKEQLVLRTREVLEATQQQKNSVEGNVESKQVQVSKLEATVKSLSEELIKANGIIKKLQGDLKALVGKIKVKNTVTVSQEKILQETTEKLQREQRELQDAQQRLRQREEEVTKLKEQLDATVQKLDESREVLKTNENVITWLNKQLNENQLSRKQETLGMFETPAAGLRTGSVPHSMVINRCHLKSSMESAKQGVVCRCSRNYQFDCFLWCDHISDLNSGEPVGLDSKYFERRDDSIPLRGLLPNNFIKYLISPSTEVPKSLNTAGARPAASTASAYFPG
uniref:Spindle assembly abnormal protein 6 homolog n=1 Tax=Cyprinus carpio TaxID=7962 RepID=A0A8C2CDJ1_CYPCA